MSTIKNYFTIVNNLKEEKGKPRITKKKKLSKI